MEKEDKDRQLQECLELADQKLQQMLTEVVAELAQPVAVLSKVMLLVPGGAGVGRACSSAAHSRKDRRHRSCCPSEMGALPECQTVPAPVSSLR